MSVIVTMNVGAVGQQGGWEKRERAVALASAGEGEGELGVSLMREVLERVVAGVGEAAGEEGARGARLVGFGFSLRFSAAGGEATVLGEEAFFARAALHPELDGLVCQYIEATVDSKGRRLWMNDEVPAARAAARALALRDKAHLATYEAFLRTHDMDHEVEQYSDLQALVERWGWCEELYPLVAARALTLGGQHGDEQLSVWIEEEGLDSHLAGDEPRRTFLVALQAECERWRALYGAHLDDREQREQIRVWLGDLVEVIGQAELDACLAAEGR